MIKKILFAFSLSVSCSLVAQNTIPNGNFEHWDSVIYLNPIPYQTANDGGGNLPPGAPSNVTRVAGWHGKYGVQLSTIVYNKDTGFAYITNSINNPVNGQGGIPYNQEPTGFRIYYKCSVMPKDSAGVMFVFKQGGKVIGTYYYTFTGTTSSYTLFSKTFSPALTKTPDTVIFAATSSNIIYGGNGKAGSSLTIDSVSFTGVFNQPALLFGDFEQWAADSSYTPTQWLAFTSGNARSTDHISGRYSLQLTNGTTSGSGNSTQEGYATDGHEYPVGPHNDSIIGGSPYNKTNDSLIFFYKYLPAGKDTGGLYWQFTKSAKIVFSSFMLLPKATSWERVSIPISLGTAPDSALIAFYGSNGNPINGSILRIDSMFFYSQIVSGIPSVAEGAGNIKVYPNPTNNLIYVDATNYSGKVDVIYIYDMSGRLMESRNYNFSPLHNTVEEFDMSGYSAGAYFISIKTSGGVRVEKVSKIQ